MHKNYAPKSMETPKSNPSTLFYGYALPPLTSQCKYAGTVGSISTVKVNIPRLYIRREALYTTTRQVAGQKMNRRTDRCRRKSSVGLLSLYHAGKTYICGSYTHRATIGYTDLWLLPSQQYCYCVSVTIAIIMSVTIAIYQSDYMILYTYIYKLIYR